MYLPFRVYDVVSLTAKSLTFAFTTLNLVSYYLAIKIWFNKPKKCIV